MTFPDFKKIDIFFEKFCLSQILCHIVIFHKFMQKVRKNRRVHSQKKMLLTKELTDNTEFIGPVPTGV